LSPNSPSNIQLPEEEPSSYLAMRIFNQTTPQKYNLDDFGGPQTPNPGFSVSDASQEADFWWSPALESARMMTWCQVHLPTVDILSCSVDSRMMAVPSQ